MGDIFIKDFPMDLNGKWGTFSEHIVVHGDGNVTDVKGRAIGGAKAIQIVRCYDCKYSERSGYWCALLSTEMEPEDFCSYSERKE